MSNYEYKQVQCNIAPRANDDPAWIAEAANYWMAQGWETVSVIPPNRNQYTYLLVRRPIAADSSLVGLEHNHPSEVRCTNACPVMIAWENLGGPKGPRG